MQQLRHFDCCSPQEFWTDNKFLSFSCWIKKREIYYLISKVLHVFNCGSSAADEAHLLCNRDPSSGTWLRPSDISLKTWRRVLYCQLISSVPTRPSAALLWAVPALIKGDIVLLAWMPPITLLGRSYCLDGQLAYHVGHITAQEALLRFSSSHLNTKLVTKGFNGFHPDRSSWNQMFLTLAWLSKINAAALQWCDRPAHLSVSEHCNGFCSSLVPFPVCPTPPLPVLI